MFVLLVCRFVRKLLGPIIVAIKKVASAYSGHCTKTLRRARDHFLLVLTLARFFTAEASFASRKTDEGGRFTKQVGNCIFFWLLYLVLIILLVILNASAPPLATYTEQNGLLIKSAACTRIFCRRGRLQCYNLTTLANLNAPSLLCHRTKSDARRASGRWNAKKRSAIIESAQLGGRQ